MTIVSLEVDRPGFLGGGVWKLNNLNSITLIFGKNGAGKSILLRQIRQKDENYFHYCVPERGGNIAYEASYMRLEADGKGRAQASKQNFTNEYRSRIITRIAEYLVQRGAHHGNISGQTLVKIENYLKEILPEFSFRIKAGYPPFELTRVEQGQAITDVEFLSSGEAQLLTLCLDIILICEMWKLNSNVGMLLVDEPDTHLHPDMQQKLARFLVMINRDYSFQILIATHSTTLLSALGHYGDSQTSVIYVSDNNEMDAIPFDKVLKTLSTCLGGHALMGPLFSVPIVLVEGDDDYKIWSQVPRHGVLHIAVIPCNGDEIFDYQKVLEKLFASIMKNSELMGFALLDGDKPEKTDDQNFIKFLRLSCHESENLYLADEVLQKLNYDWDSAKKKIVEKSVDFGNKQAELQAVTGIDRKEGDVKNIINEIAVILDNKRLPWTYRLGKILGEQKPEGQLKEFLGAQVVDNMWNQ